MSQVAWWVAGTVFVTLLLLWLGVGLVRGRVSPDRPRCRACGADVAPVVRTAHELAGLRCPSCQAALDGRRAVRFARGRPRRILGAGVAGLAIVTAIVGTHRAAGDELAAWWIGHAPDAWLAARLVDCPGEGPDPTTAASWEEVARRAADDRLGAQSAQRVIDAFETLVLEHDDTCGRMLIERHALRCMRALYRFGHLTDGRAAAIDRASLRSLVIEGPAEVRAGEVSYGMWLQWTGHRVSAVNGAMYVSKTSAWFRCDWVIEIERVTMRWGEAEPVVVDIIPLEPRMSMMDGNHEGVRYPRGWFVEVPAEVPKGPAQICAHLRIGFTGPRVPQERVSEARFERLRTPGADASGRRWDDAVLESTEVATVEVSVVTDRDARPYRSGSNRREG